jgi:hypothetical protein
VTQPLPPDRLVCFKDKTRVCGPDCMAYITRPTGDDYRDQQWANCLLLVNSHRTGKHLVILADAVSKQAQKAATALADAARTNQPPPPMPK